MKITNDEQRWAPTRSVNDQGLSDGRRVRLLGIDAPDPGKCAADGATQYVRERVEGRHVRIHSEDGGAPDVDEHGQLLRFVAYTDPDSKYVRFDNDLGRDLVYAGWARPHEDTANHEYDESIASARDIAQYESEGIYAPPCGKPKVYGDDDGNGVADYEEGDGNINPPNLPNLPDGALTGGFCRHHRWC